MHKTQPASLVMLALSAALVLTASAQPAASNDASAEAAYTRTITKRSAAIVAALELADGAKSNRVQQILVDQYRALNTWHDAHDAELKALNKSANGPDAEAATKAREEAAKIQATLKPRHDEFLTKLAAELTPAQVETVKDGMTYNKVQFTFKGYTNVVPNMSEEERAHVLGLLKEAREFAIDAGSADEKSAIFNKFKGRINNYLSARGHDTSGKPKSNHAPKSE